MSYCPGSAHRGPAGVPATSCGRHGIGVNKKRRLRDIVLPAFWIPSGTKAKTTRTVEKHAQNHG